MMGNTGTGGAGKQADNAWRVTGLLFLACLFNYYDRIVPTALLEPIRKEWGLNDAQLGLTTSAFTIVYALASVPIGRWADKYSRKHILGWGLLIWSLFTGMTGLAWGFASFLAIRVLVGVGEASYQAPATSLIGDLFPADKRSGATGIFLLGLPVGLLLGFFTTGAIAQYFGNWRAPLFVAAVPGILLAFCMFFIKEPARGASEVIKISEHPIDRPFLRVFKTPTVWALLIAGLALAMASNAASAFLTSTLIRYFHLSLKDAGMASGIIVGASGLIGLPLGGWLSNRLHRRHEHARMYFSAISVLIAAVLIHWALKVQNTEVTMFVALFGLAWVLQYHYYASSLPVLMDVFEPRLRATATAVSYAVSYIVGGTAGPVLLGLVSDHNAKAAMAAAGAMQMTDEIRALGLLHSMEVVPIALAVCGVGLLLATRTYSTDAAAAQRAMAGAAA